MNSEGQELLIDTIEASLRFQGVMTSLLPTLEISLNSFDPNIEDNQKAQLVKEARHFLNGSIIVYLFSMWDTYFTPLCVDKYFRDKEKKIFFAFKHLRIVAAHNIDGSRRGNRDDRMRHAEKLDEIMDSENKIEGLIISEYSLDMSNCYAALDCQNFLAKMASLLASGRISAGGANNKIRTVGPQGYGTTEVM